MLHASIIHFIILLQALFQFQAGRAYEVLSNLGQSPRGFAFWNILDEGLASPQRPKEPVWMAVGLNRFLKVRSEASAVGVGTDI